MNELGKLSLSEYPLGAKKLDRPAVAALTTTFTITDLVLACRDAGFKSGSGLVNAVAVSCAEDTTHILEARYTNTDGSVDRGPFQINDHWHSEVSDACAYSLKCAAQQAFVISKQGTNFTPWSSWNNGAYRVHMEAAFAAVALVDCQTNNQTLRTSNAALVTNNTNLTTQVASLTDQLSNVNFALTAARKQYDDSVAKSASLTLTITQARDTLNTALTVPQIV